MCMAIGKQRTLVIVIGMMVTSISVRTLSPPSPIGGQHPQALLHVLSCWCLAHAALVQGEVLTPFSAYAVPSRPDAFGEPEAHVFIWMFCLLFTASCAHLEAH